jgi:hypothetical protein
MNTEQRIAELEKQLSDAKREASNEIYVLKEENRYLRNRVEFLCNK